MRKALYVAFVTFILLIMTSLVAGITKAAALPEEKVKGCWANGILGLDLPPVQPFADEFAAIVYSVTGQKC
jgi:hypothetical protein